MITAVKARIRLWRSFDQISHSYLGYNLVLDGDLDGRPEEELRIAVGPKAHERHKFRIGDQVDGMAAPVPYAETEWATHYLQGQRPAPRLQGPVRTGRAGGSGRRRRPAVAGVPRPRTSAAGKAQRLGRRK